MSTDPPPTSTTPGASTAAAGGSGPPPAEAAPLRLACSEVWGGNRPINTEVDLPGVRGKVYSQPCAGGRGGDIHYLSVCDSGLVCQMLVADVVGHGEAVSGVSGEIHSLLRRYLNRLDQRHVLKRLNQRLEKIGFEAFTTAAAVNYFPPWRRLSLSYAGHPVAWFYRKATGRWSQITSDGRYQPKQKWVNLPLAVDPRTIFTRRTIKVDYGDRLLVLTDGVLETPDQSGKLLGTSRLRKLLEEASSGTPGDIVDAIVGALAARAGETGFSHDDVTLLLVEFVPGPPGPAVWHALKNRLPRLARRIAKPMTPG
jgi:serine phosphatase RsbU (regulator of sigma subunit)